MQREWAQKVFEEKFGGHPDVVAFAPGRVNLIGEHTDYNGGFVFPVAIHMGITVAMRQTEGPSKCYSAQLGPGAEFSTQDLSSVTASDWSVYPAAIARTLNERFETTVPNAEIIVVSEIPPGAGLSSSAALEVALALGWIQLSGSDLTSVEIAQLCQKAENDYVGVKCGIMDMLAIVCGRAEQAMFIDTRSLDIRTAAIPDRMRIVVCNTNVQHSLASGEYNLRRKQCEEAAANMGVSELRDADLELLFAKEAEMDPILVRRARHVITENTRCQGLFWALADSNDLRTGLLMRASHESLQQDFEVTCLELDAMAEACWMAPGCIGARMTGGGFGGCCVALVETERVESFIRSVEGRYRSKTEIEPNFYLCLAVDGAYSARTR